MISKLTFPYSTNDSPYGIRVEKPGMFRHRFKYEEHASSKPHACLPISKST